MTLLIFGNRNGNLNPHFSLSAEMSKLHQESEDFFVYRKLVYVSSSYYLCQNREDACVLLFLGL